MKKLYRLFILLGLLSTQIEVSAQDQFERRYPILQSNVIASSLENVGTGYAMLGVEINTDDERENINLTFLDKKGTILSSRSIIYGDSIKIKEVGEVVRLVDGSFIFSAVLDKDSLNKVVTRVDNLGNHFWTVITGQQSDLRDLASSPSVVLDVPGERIFHAHTIDAGSNSTDIQLTSVNYLGQIEYVRQITFQDSTGSGLNERFVKMHVAQDLTIMILGTTNSANDPFFLTKMDTLGNIIWTRSYNTANGRTMDNKGFDFTQMIDGSWVILGSVIPTVTERHEGILMTIDGDGNRLRTESIHPSSVRYQLYPNGIEGMLDSSVVISLKRLDMISNVCQPLVINYDLDSIIAYQTLLDTCISEDPDIADLVTIDSMSATFLTTTEKDGFLIPNLSKLDDQGATQCEESVMTVMIDTLEFSESTLTSEISEMMVIDSVKVEIRPFGRYNPPILNLQDTTYCPQDPINYFVDATVRGGVVYIWDDGSTDSTRVFTEEGMYMVTVAVIEDICFTLCDTLTISKLDFPMVDIVKNFGNYCSTGNGILNANISGASIQSFMWNTGSTDAAIVVDGTSAEYSITVTDGCGNSASANTAVSESDYLQPNPLGLVISRENVCEDGTLTITASTQSDPSLISWSTGESNTLSISVNTSGTYSADVAGFCPDSEDITINDGDFIPPVEAEINFDCGNPGILSVTGTGFISQTWSTGDNTGTVNISQPGVYSVILTDECGDNQPPLEISVSAEDLDGCTTCDNPCLIWPNAFQPQDGELENKTFGPKVLGRCDNGLVSYELRIYNRWGKNIFTSTDVNTTWNGAVDGNPQPGGVYYYWSNYNDGTTTCERKGDLTLLR